MARERGMNWHTMNSRLNADKRADLIQTLFQGIPELPDKSIIGYAPWDEQRRKLHKKFLGVRKAIVLTDLHAPYQDIDLVKEALRRDGDADLGIWGGDFLTVSAFSSFARYEGTPFETELKVGERLIADACQVVPRWVALMGNHERRLLRHLVERVSADGLNLVRKHFPNILDILVRAANEKTKRALPIDVMYDWWIMIGDVAICHADEFSQVPGRSATNVWDWLRNHQKGRYGVWPSKPISAVVQAHTHHLAHMVYQEVHAWETGCLCYDEGYKRMGKLGAGRKEKWQRGYVVLEFDGKGTCDLNASRFVHLA